MPAIKEAFNSFVESIVDFLYPKICIISGERLPQNNSNDFVRDDLTAGFESAGEKQFRDYKAALNTEFFFSSYVFRNDNEIQTLIHYMKYRGFTKIGEFFGEKAGNAVINSNIDALKNFHYLLPVPLFPSRLRERGYNQSYHICKGINKALKLEIIEQDILRTKNTKSQTGLSYDERVINVRDAFTLKDESIPMLMNKGVIIVDDVLTTGSTIKEIVRTIKKSTNAKTGVITLAVVKS